MRTYIIEDIVNVLITGSIIHLVDSNEAREIRVAFAYFKYCFVRNFEPNVNLTWVGNYYTFKVVIVDGPFLNPKISVQNEYYIVSYIVWIVLYLWMYCCEHW